MTKEKTRYRKPFEELTITDDFMFCKVMLNPAICRRLLTAVLGDTVGEIQRVSYQESIDPGINKGIRMDVLVKDGTGRILDVEMQITYQKNLPKRNRYYQASIDVSDVGLKAGDDYNELPDSVIIFFCPFDFLGADLPVYTIKPVCLETGKVYEDGTTKILINSKAALKALDEDLKAFLELMNGNADGNAFTEMILQEIESIKQNTKWRDDYMKLSAYEADIRRESKAEGIEIGKVEGIEIGKEKGRAEERKKFQNALIELVQEGILSITEAANKMEISPAEFKNLML